MKVKHTSTPWNTGGQSFGQIWEEANGLTVATAVSSANIYTNKSINPDEALANAAFIVQAVNAHEVLVEALEDSNSLLNSLISGEATEMIVAQIADNLAALALVGVKEVKGE